MSHRSRDACAIALLLVLVAAVTNVALRHALPELGWPDEWIYLTLARNIAEKASLNTNFYIASSIDLIGYPHHDVHLPGYALSLAAVGSALGHTFRSAVQLNVLCFAISVISAFVLARRFFPVSRSLVAAGLVALLPPYPGYLAVVYPEHVTAAALLALVAAAAWVEGRVATFILGFLMGVSLLFRETLLFAGPLFAGLLGLRRTLRFFVPGFLLALLTVLPPLSTHRAVHPNALYPSAVIAALESSDHVGRLTTTSSTTRRSTSSCSSPQVRENAPRMRCCCLCWRSLSSHSWRVLRCRPGRNSSFERPCSPPVFSSPPWWSSTWCANAAECGEACARSCRWLRCS
ncbi:MAG: hypothetical protein ABIR28_05615 [Vicinamibacteria bacterium]